MKQLLILLCFLTISWFGNSQDNTSIIMNDPLIKEYFVEFIHKAELNGLDVQDQLLADVDYILIVPEDQDNVKNLGEYDSQIKFIKLSSKVKLDALILKVTLFRELSHILGVPYDQGSVIMYRNQKDGFSYAAFDDIDILNIELGRVLSSI